MRTFTAILLSVLTIGYLLPTSIALVRRVPTGLCFVVNLLLGWTVIGWIVAFILAFRTPPQAVPA